MASSTSQFLSSLVINNVPSLSVFNSIQNKQANQLYLIAEDEAIDWDDIQNKPTTLSGYGITDAVPSSRKINNKTLTADISLTASDVGALANSTIVNKVKQTSNSANTAYKVLFGTTDSPTSGSDYETYYGSLTYNPSTKALVTGGTVDGYTLAAAAEKGVVTSISNSTDLPTAGAVKSFVEGKGYVTSSGVTKVQTGAGLTGGDITTTGTVKANLTNEEKLTNVAADGTETSGRVYPVRLDKNGKLAVNVPWTNVNSNYQTTLVFDETYDASTNKAATVKTVTDAINALDGGTIGTGSKTKTITSLSQTNGNVSATFETIDFPVSSVAGLSGVIKANDLTTALGLSSAMHYRGTSAAIPPESGTYVSGDVLVKTSTDEEYVYDGTSWRLLGSEGSYKIKQTAISAPTAETNKWVSSIGQDADGAITVSYSSLVTSGPWNGKAGTAGTADKISNLTTTDKASNSDTWRRVWISYTNNTEGRPAYTDELVFQTSTNTLKTTNFQGNLIGNADSATNLVNNPSIQASTSNANQVTITAGGKTSSAYTIPYATSAGRLTANTSFAYGDSGLTWFDINGTIGNAVQVNDTPTTAWWHILRFNHSNNSSYYTDLAIPFNAKSLYYKRIINGTVSDGKWVQVLDEDNYINYAAKTDGINATGNWPIDITGSAGSVAWGNVSGRPTNVSSFTNDAGYLTSYTETDPTVPAWAKADSKPSYTASEVGALASSTVVNNVAISGNIITEADYPIVFATSDKNTIGPVNEGLQKSGAKFYFNPSTGNVVSTLFNNLTLTAATTGFTIAGGTTTSKTLTVAGTAIINAPTQWGIVYGGASGAYTSTEAGTSGQYLKSNGNAAPTWATFSASTVGLGNVTNDAQIPKSIGTAKGDIIYFDGSASPKRLEIGTNGQVLKIASGIPSWGTDNNDDTKNTAGSTDSTSRLYLIGATEQSANPQTYSNSHVFETNGAFSAKTLGVNDNTDNDKVILQWNDTDSSLDFIFA